MILLLKSGRLIQSFHNYFIIMYMISDMRKGYDPKLPVLQGACAHIVVKHLPHLVGPLSGHRGARGRQLLLAQTETKICILFMVKCLSFFFFNSLLNLHRDLPVLFVSSLDYWGTFCAGGLPTSIFVAGAGIRTHSMAISTSSAAALMTSATTPPLVLWEIYKVPRFP